MVEFTEPVELEAALEDEERDMCLPRGLAEQLEADRNRHDASLSPEGRRELLERVIRSRSAQLA